MIRTEDKKNLSVLGVTVNLWIIGYMSTWRVYLHGEAEDWEKWIFREKIWHILNVHCLIDRKFLPF